MATVDAVERAGQALLDEPLLAANNVLPLLAKLRDPAAHDEVGRCAAHVSPARNLSAGNPIGAQKP